MGHSRNFTLSPETTSCDSGDVESDYSGVDPEGSVHSSSRGICSAMPVLEDGLSSGECNPEFIFHYTITLLKQTFLHSYCEEINTSTTHWQKKVVTWMLS